MIAMRWSLSGLFILGLGWQMVMGETRADAFWPGSALVVLGLLLVLVGLRRLSPRLVAGYMIAIFTVTSFSALALVELFARVQEVTPLTRGVGWLSMLGGLSPVFHDGRIMVHDGMALMDWRPSLPYLAAFPFAMTFTGVATFFLLTGGRGAFIWLLKVSGLLAAVFLVRGPLLAVLHTTLPDQGVVTSPAFTLVTTLPFVLLCALDMPVTRSDPPRRSVVQPVTLAVMMLMAIIALRFVDPGIRGGDRILFADAHGRWEPTDLPFDKVNFGRRNAYSYGNLYALLGQYFDVQRFTEGRITPERLDGIDVLILKTPTVPFSDDEIDRVEAFVQKGGGLLLIGDHTDLFGMSTFMNRLSKRFGIRFRSDDTFSLHDEGTSQWRRSAFLPHPIVKDIKSFDYETSASLDVTPRAEIVMAGHALGAEMADFNNPGFFGNIHLDPRDRLGFFPQVVALRHGEGRVVAFSDSTPFSNFSLYFPGRWELALSSVDYLSREPGPLRSLRGFAVIAAGLALVAATAFRGRGTVVANSAGLAVGAVAGSLLTYSLSQAQVDFPQPHTELPRVAFDRSITAAVFPPSLDTNESLNPHAYDTLFTVVQRVGFQPIMTESLDDAMETAKMIVILNPEKSLDPATATRLFEYVSRGGSLLVTDSLLNRNTMANVLLRPFDLQVVAETAIITPDPVIPDPTAPTVALQRPLLTIEGGYPVLMDSSGRALYSEVEVGAGHVGVLSEALALSRGSLGNRFYDTPDKEQQERYNAAFMVLERGLHRTP
ncbi:DUF4350 domain-containing protein [Sagittula salina]|uniref:DUF4350 domain-containing protein n=1 Tax=Sagittula salina TaxID=2820268 RepID=A0A940MN54_9RHOB|nr:DUF4350 domain-containing protein [Sagittula salina]MBP0482790.1 hypothetical protein [Sagittula salina]